MKQIKVPAKIQEFIDNKPYTIDNIGMSGNQVLIFDNMVLKMEDNMTSVAEQVLLMKWLDGKLEVPKVIAYEEWNGKSFLLMSKIEGKMSCDIYYLEHPEILLDALVCGLKMLWEVDVSECPRVRDLDHVLKDARLQVENGLVDLDNVEPETFDENGFKNPMELLVWLEENKPAFEPVFSHGDFCLPNIFLEDGKVKGFIDLERSGVSDKWNDIAICYRSLKHNFDGTYGGKVYKDFQPEWLFEKLGIEPDWKKIKYYLLLDELF